MKRRPRIWSFFLAYLGLLLVLYVIARIDTPDHWWLWMGAQTGVLVLFLVVVHIQHRRTIQWHETNKFIATKTGYPLKTD